jgi:hypothetical protein
MQKAGSPLGDFGQSALVVHMAGNEMSPHPRCPSLCVKHTDVPVTGPHSVSSKHGSQNLPVPAQAPNLWIQMLPASPDASQAKSRPQSASTLQDFAQRFCDSFGIAMQ